jgi:hypothetical protein
MPSLRNWQLLRATLFTKFTKPSDDDVQYLYDDPIVNERLGIKRHGGTYDWDNAPLPLVGTDAKSFTSYVSALVNASEAQLKSDTEIGTAHGTLLWKAFAKRVVPRINTLIEEHMDQCGAHPVQLMHSDGIDDWCNNWSASHASRVSFSCLVDLIGDEKTTSRTGASLVMTFQSFVYLNYDRLRRNFLRALKSKSQLIQDLDKLYNRVSSY